MGRHSFRMAVKPEGSKSDLRMQRTTRAYSARKGTALRLDHYCVHQSGRLIGITACLFVHFSTILSMWSATSHALVEAGLAAERCQRNSARTASFWSSDNGRSIKRISLRWLTAGVDAQMVHCHSVSLAGDQTVVL